MKVTEEDLRGIMKSIQINIDGLRNSEIDIDTRINITTLSLLSLKHSIENGIYKMRVGKNDLS